MAIILRADVDKPFGKHTFLRKVASKLKEDYFYSWHFELGYLSQLKEMLQVCNAANIQGTFYHRICTLPDSETVELIEKGNHDLGLHLENSRTEQSFIKEWEKFRNHKGCERAVSFSKHGSGLYKLGKYHYPPYEPEIYQLWANRNNFQFPSGNGIATQKEDLYANERGYFKSLFWLEPNYRNSRFASINSLIDAAKEGDVVALIHPCNFKADPITRIDFEKMIELAAQNNIRIKSFKETLK